MPLREKYMDNVHIRGTKPQCLPDIFGYNVSLKYTQLHTHTYTYIYGSTGG